MSDHPREDAERLIRASRRGLTLAFVPCQFHSRRAGIATGARADVVIGAAKDLLRSFVAIRLHAKQPPLIVREVVLVSHIEYRELFRQGQAW